jgi:AAA domain
MSRRIHKEGYSYIEIDGNPLEDERPPFLVEGIVSSTLTLLYGAPKSGKSTLAAALAVAVANGGTYLEKPAPRGKVAIVTGDPSDDDQYYRYAYGRVPDGAVTPYAFSRPPMAETWGKVCYEIERNGTNLAIIDNLTAFAPGGDVSDQRSFRTFYDGVIDQLTRNGIAVVLIHHTSEKRGEHGGYSRTPMGHTAISAAARWKWRIETPDVTGPSRLTFEGNYGPKYEMLVTRPGGVADFDVIEVTQPDELAARRRNRQRATMDRNAEIARWVVDNCQGVTSNTEAGRRVAGQYGGSEGTHRVMLGKGAYPVRHEGDGRWSLAV